MKTSTKVTIIVLCLVVIALSSCLVIGFIRRAQFDVVGYWKIDQPMHALYEASVYEFKSNGELRLVENYTFDGSSEYNVGSVRKSNNPDCPPLINCSPVLMCEFGNEWHSYIFQILTISGVCSDGVQRDINIWLDPYPAPYSIYQSPYILSVDGEWGWYHGPFNWLWTKCIDLDDCLSWE